MAVAETKSQVLIARLVVVLIVAFILVGIWLNGFSSATWHRFWDNIIHRPGGPMTFRFILQPTMAAIAALLAGIRDARAGRVPYLWSLATKPDQRAGLLREGLIGTARVLLLGLVMDAIYQYLVLKTFYPGEAVAIALLLAFLPYLLLRGPADRVARWWIGRSGT